MTGTLEGHWVLDEDSGSTAYDYSGNENHGSHNGGVGPSGTGTATGPFDNSAYRFDATDDVVDIGKYLIGSDTTVPWSISAWININDQTQPQVVYGELDTDNFARNAAVIVNSSSINVEIYDGIDYVAFKAIDYAASNNEWVHVGASYDGSQSPSGMEAYINGATGSVSSTQNESNTNDVSLSETAGIGGRPADSGNIFDGEIADVRVWGRVVSPQEFQALYQAGVESEVIFE